MHPSTIIPAFIGLAAAGINSITFTGTGCAPGTAAPEIASDGLSGNLIFDTNTVLGTTSSRGCAITVSWTAPAGWTQSSVLTNYRGFTDVAAGATGRFTSPGGGRTFNGPFRNDWTIAETRSISGSQTITFNTGVALSGPIDPADTISLFSFDIGFSKA